MSDWTYFVPDFNTAANGVITRYDTTATFTTGAAWSTFDTTTVNANPQQFRGGAFDGRNVYFVPYFINGNPDGVTAVYDTTAVFTSSSSWSSFDMTTVNVGAKGFFGGAFDGRYAYFVSLLAGTHILARYDTTATLMPSAWSTFDMSSVSVQVGASARGLRRGRVFDRDGQGQLLRRRLGSATERDRLPRRQVASQHSDGYACGQSAKNSFRFHGSGSE